jgi:NitT/TauT family transport system ATP-binding protein
MNESIGNIEPHDLGEDLCGPCAEQHLEQNRVRRFVVQRLTHSCLLFVIEYEHRADSATTRRTEASGTANRTVHVGQTARGARYTPAAMREPALLSVNGVTLQYRTGEQLVTATYRVSFEVLKGDRFVVLGPSGCGKSTLLKAIGGYLTPVEGEMLLNGTRIGKPGPDRAFVFQEFDQLLPWKTVRDNVVFALTASGKLAKKPATERALHVIDKVGLAKFADNFPHTLSGGMKQRVAIARAMAMEPQILLMDEPFAALDALTRGKMQEDLLQLWEDTRFTVVFVTHSIPEAIRIGNRILLLTPHPGRTKAEINCAGQDAVGDGGELLSARIQRLLFDRTGAIADV